MCYASVPAGNLQQVVDISQWVQLLGLTLDFSWITMSLRWPEDRWESPKGRGGEGRLGLLLRPSGTVTLPGGWPDVELRMTGKAFG